MPQPTTPLDGWRWWQRAGLLPARFTHSGRFVLGLWLLTRAFTFLVWAIGVLVFHLPSAQTDVSYYFTSMRTLGLQGPQHTMVEYPTPVLAVMWLVQVASGGRFGFFLVGFVLLMLVLDGWFTLRLWRAGGPHRGDAVVAWTVFLVLLGPTAYLRFDLVPGVLAGFALLEAARHRHGRAGALVGLGAAMKLWPAVLWPATVARDAASRWRSLLGAVVVGGGLAVASVLWAGWGRLLSPLTWQSDRGLQIESVPATVPMLMRGFHPAGWTVALSPFKAYEISGPGTAAWLGLADATAPLGYLLIAVASVRWWTMRAPQRRIEATAMMVFAMAVLIASNKTFSPQYTIWLAAPLTAGLATDDGVPEEQLHLWATARLTVLLGLLTVLVYPVGYAFLVRDSPLTWLVTVVLVTRNLVTLGLLAWVTHWVWTLLVARRTP